MKPCYIHSIASISAQDTFENSLFLKDILVHTTTTVKAIPPTYRDYITPAVSRRMATGVKMGVVAAKIALQEAEITMPDAVIIGTGMGCIEDSEKFLSTIIENDEQYLTPTSFIQSTHNTVGAQIALGLKCKGYNMTYVHGASSFESALLDAQLLLHEEEKASILVGSVDELGKKFITDYVALEDPKKVPYSEGAHFFTLSNSPKNYYAILKDVTCIQTIHVDDITKKAIEFLAENNLEAKDIDLIFLGKNGDIYDTYYSNLQDSLFKNTTQLQYKHLCGEYHTASAFGFWAASKILKEQAIPDSLVLNNIQKSTYKTILLYNQYKGAFHSFTLLTA
ncbi:beta-ketoacyl synthase chain length factor [Polaribacter sp.]|uniref:beta-ketoacyl synthase chain length factor n=1 Tax=Polaribacter sp. TaxID=1920175 RepID=UPI003EF094E7